MKEISWIKIAAITGALAVLLGAFGAHALSEHLEKLDRVSTWQTAVNYHMAHTLAILALSFHSFGKSGFSLVCWLLGIILFSGSLYALGFGAPNWFGAITPVGGLFFIAGWLGLFFIKKA